MGTGYSRRWPCKEITLAVGGGGGTEEALGIMRLLDKQAPMKIGYRFQAGNLGN